MTQQYDIIQKQSIEIIFEGFDEAVGMQDRIAEVFYERLKPSMEKVFNEEAGEKYSITMERLEIDCGILTAKNWEDQWVDTTLRKLREELRAGHKKRIITNDHSHPDTVEPEVSKESVEASFFFFLQHGNLPWNARIHSTAEMEALIQFDDDPTRAYPAPIIHLKELIIRYEQVAKRLALQFSGTFRDKIIQLQVQGKEKYFGQIISLLRDHELIVDPRQLDGAFIYAFAVQNEENILPVFFKFLHDITPQKERREVLEKITEKIFGNKDILKNQTKPPDGKEKETINVNEAIYINNAGIIIVHPFLPELFKELQLLNPDGWPDRKTQHNAAMILEYLVSGKEEFSECDMPLNKLLCGIDTAEVLESDIEINDKIRDTCNELLTVIIRHWSILKNTSVDSLQETFFQRNGKLSHVDNGWLLQVEQKGVDILLGHLSWGIGTIKLPWMEEILFTEWG